MVKSIMDVLPKFQITYLGDTARLPYGNRSLEAVHSFTLQGVDFLFKEGCTLVILACNTASAEALRKIQQEYLPRSYPNRRVLGVVVPVVEEAIKLSRYHRLGVIGTTATINSGVYKKELEKLRNDLEIFEQACPLLVPLVEEGWIDKPEANMILKKYLRPLKVKEIDTLLLGCTHYPLLLKDISRIMGKNVKVVNPAEVAAERLVVYLNKHQDLEKKLNKNNLLVFYTTDDASKFKELGQKFLGKSIGEAKKIEL